MQSGQVIAGKYRLNQPIGAGGMASVWSATNTFTERQLAIKFMSPSVARSAEAARRFLNEAKASARINHPNIIDILDVGQAEDGAFFLVMELLTGVNLDTAIRRQTPPMLVHEFLGIMLDVGRALAAAHKAGVVHRDLKPTNIFLHMVREDVAVPKLLDFGVSKFLEDEQMHALTLVGTVLGSPLYMSPEQAMGAENIDGRTDIFAFGAILFEGLCGYRPYEAPNFNALIVKVATKQPKSIDECAASMPAPLRALVRDCLVTDRDKRLASFDEAVDRLLGMLADIEQSGLRLPPHPSATDVDPEATQARPVLRSSDRPPSSSGAPGVQLSKPPSVPPGASPPGAFSAPWNAGERNAITVRRPPAVWMFAASGAAAALVVGGFALWAARSSFSSGHTPLASEPVSVSVPSPATAQAAGASEPPVVNVDSLPVASGKPSVPIGRGMGRVSVASSGGSCVVSIDGIGRGPTPVVDIELSAGPHKLSCAPPSGKPKSMNVLVVEGTTSKFRVALD